MSTPVWQPVCAVDELAPGDQQAFSVKDDTVAVFRLEDGSLHAVSNVCPHEGYPLVGGDVKDCVLTCAWHNFKFDLRDGSCVKGDEDVRSYAVRENAGDIEIDVSPAPTEHARTHGFAALKDALHEHAVGRMARETTRLLKLGVPPQEILAAGVHFDAKHAEWGLSHAMAVSCDVLELLPTYPGYEAVMPLLIALDVTSEPNQRRPARALPPAVDVGRDQELAASNLLRAIENEDADLAQGIVRGALRAGFGRTWLEPTLDVACTAHFLDFGHSLIYQRKIFDTLEALGLTDDETVLCAHVFRIINATREDTLPPMRGVAEHLNTRATAKVGRRPLSAAQREALVESMLDRKEKETVVELERALSDGVDPAELFDALIIATAWRLWSFDEAVDADAGLQDNWLFATHPMTFAAAARQTWEKNPGQQTLRSLFYGLHFLARSRRIETTPRRPLATLASGGASEQPPVATMAKAIATKNPAAAIGAAAALLNDDRFDGDARTALDQLVVADLAVRPIFAAHIIKTTRVGLDEYARLAEHPMRRVLVLATVRFLAERYHERPLAGASHDAVRLVAHGRLPKRLSS